MENFKIKDIENRANLTKLEKENDTLREKLRGLGEAVPEK